MFRVAFVGFRGTTVQATIGEAGFIRFQLEIITAYDTDSDREGHFIFKANTYWHLLPDVGVRVTMLAGSGNVGSFEFLGFKSVR